MHQDLTVFLCHFFRYQIRGTSQKSVYNFAFEPVFCVLPAALGTVAAAAALVAYGICSIE